MQSNYLHNHFPPTLWKHLSFFFHYTICKDSMKKLQTAKEYLLFSFLKVSFHCCSRPAFTMAAWQYPWNITKNLFTVVLSKWLSLLLSSCPCLTLQSAISFHCKDMVWCQFEETCWDEVIWRAIIAIFESSSFRIELVRGFDGNVAVPCCLLKGYYDRYSKKDSKPWFRTIISNEKLARRDV